VGTAADVALGDVAVVAQAINIRATAEIPNNFVLVVIVFPGV
jgi:hypothetical protein